jgi:hypothetical protein
VAAAGSLTEAAQALNRGVWATWEPPLRFVADQTPAIMSPFQVIAHGYGNSPHSAGRFSGQRMLSRPAGCSEAWASRALGNHQLTVSLAAGGGAASCTGMSTLLVDALRSQGIPARAAGTPRWNNPAGGNHVWVEVSVRHPLLTLSTAGRR